MLRSRRLPSWWPLVVVAGMSLVGVLLRLPSLSDSLYGDELGAYFVVTGRDVAGIIDTVQTDQEITPPLYFLFAALTQGIGDSMDSLRWVPMLSGIAAIPLTYLLGLRTVGRRPALTGMAIMALSPFLIFYSTEARPYALLMLLCLASTLSLLHAVERGGVAWWALYAAFSCAAMYTHYTGVFLLGGQALWALAYHRRRWLPLVVANGAVLVAWLPWLSSYRADRDSDAAGLIGLLQPFGLETLKTDVLHWAVSHPLTAFSVREMPGELALAAIGVGLAVGVIGLGLEVSRKHIRLGVPSEGVALVLVLALSTPLLAALYSAVSVSVFLPRNLIASTPGLALTLGLLVGAPRSRRLWAPATALVLFGFAIGAGQMLGSDSQRPDVKGAAEFIEEHGGSAGATVDSPVPSPGPVTSLDAAFAPGQPHPRTTALRLGRATRAAQLRAAQPGGGGVLAPLPVPTPEAIAAQAVRRGGRGPIFLIAPGESTFAQLRRQPYVVAGAFAQALPAKYRATASETFPAFFDRGTLTAYMLEPDKPR